ncbi:hypothetical protein ScPMuIL_001739 [Solemya velum]
MCADNVLRRKRNVPCTKEETLLLIRSYVADPVNWTNVIDEIKANLHQLSRPTRDLYNTATRNQLRNRLSSRIGKLLREQPQDIEDADLRMAMVDLQRQENRMRVGNRDNAPDDARDILAGNQSTSDEEPPEVEDVGHDPTPPEIPAADGKLHFDNERF